MRDHDQDESAEDLLDLTITFCQPRYERELTEEEARQIVENLVGFLGTLVRWRMATSPTIAFEDEREAA